MIKIITQIRENKRAAIKELEALHYSKDTESAHAQADAILCDLLKSLGHKKVVAVYDKIKKYYA